VREWAGAVPRLGYRDPEPYKDKGEQRGSAEQQRPPTNGSQDASSLTPYSSARTPPRRGPYRRRSIYLFCGGWVSGTCPESDRVRSEPERGSAQDVVLGDLDLLQAEQPHHLAQDHGSGDDRRRTRGIEAGCLLALFELR
jgi:hypothetical protein